AGDLVRRSRRRSIGHRRLERRPIHATSRTWNPLQPATRVVAQQLRFASGWTAALLGMRGTADRPRAAWHGSAPALVRGKVNELAGAVRHRHRRAGVEPGNFHALAVLRPAWASDSPAGHLWLSGLSGSEERGGACASVCDAVAKRGERVPAHWLV